MEASQLVEAVRLTLDPAMTDRGFGPGGPGIAPDGSVTFLFCTGAQAFAARWPQTMERLGAEQRLELDDPSRCLDFLVEASPAGDVVRLDFESVELGVLLRGADLDGWAQRCSIDDLQGLDPTDVATRIRGAVEAWLPLGTHPRRPSALAS